MTDLQFRLEQWGEWHRRGSIKPKQTGSFEGQYRSPQPWEEAPPSASRGDPPNLDDAWEIELAARCIAIKYHFGLWARYVLKADSVRMIGIFRQSVLNLKGFTPNDIDNFVGMAQVLLWEKLQLPAVERKERAAAWVKRQLPPIVESGIEPILGADYAQATG